MPVINVFLVFVVRVQSLESLCLPLLATGMCISVRKQQTRELT